MRSAPRWAAALVGLAAWLAPASPLHAQAEPLTPGREVRLFVRGVAGTFEGTLTGVRTDAVTLVLRDGSFFTLPVPQIERSQVLGRQRNTRRGALVGLAVGVGAGVAWAIASRNDCPGFCSDPGDHFDEWHLVWPAVAGAAGGAVVGRFIHTPRWVPGILPTSAASGGGFALGWTVPAAHLASRSRG